ncbi:hypothetical protein EDB89DRAFT_1856550 [Lactarius sanguifluus]|nr:hypothetical protein EDB89DRAFT_1856550 [Lactarius sanguifluus]
MTPRRPGVDRASLYSPTAQSLNPVTPGRTLGRTPGRTPGRTLGRTPGHPRTGQRRTLRRDGPAGNRKRRAAQDVWHFFAENDQRRRECLLCRKRVNDPQSAGDQHQVKTFSLTTGSSNLREHLVDCHRNEWVKSCVDLGLTIKGKDGLAARAAYEVEHSGGYLTNPSSVTSEDCPQFSPEAFVDALVEWIVANDQVRTISCVIYILSLLYSLSMLSSLVNSVGSFECCDLI